MGKYHMYLGLLSGQFSCRRAGHQLRGCGGADGCQGFGFRDIGSTVENRGEGKNKRCEEFQVLTGSPAGSSLKAAPMIMFGGRPGTPS